MSTTRIDRKAASEINPLIEDHSADTLCHVIAVLDLLSVASPGVHEFQGHGLGKVLDLCTAALAYEMDTLSPGRSADGQT